ncbi:MAG: anti-sigma factor [Thermoanaerobaculia bacterium]|nr:anti-sigma factor [Thermoanaerobaculia bacterium]
MHRAQYLDLLPAYSIGALDGDELRQLEEHLAAGCEECERQLALWRRDVEALASSVPAVEPSDAVRRAVVGRVEGRATGADGAATFWRLAAVIAVGVLGALAWLHLDLRGRVESLAIERQVTVERLAALESDLGSARNELARLRRVSGIVASPGKRLVALASLEQPAGGAFGQALVDPVGRQAVFYAYGLRPTEQGKTYQLWYIAAGEPVSAGTFEVDSEGQAMIVVEEIVPPETIDAWAVTVEPQGGVPQPTGPMVLKS